MLAPGCVNTGAGTLGVVSSLKSLPTGQRKVFNADLARSVVSSTESLFCRLWSTQEPQFGLTWLSEQWQRRLPKQLPALGLDHSLLGASGIASLTTTLLQLCSGILEGLAACVGSCTHKTSIFKFMRKRIRHQVLVMPPALVNRLASCTHGIHGRCHDIRTNGVYYSLPWLL